MYFAARLTIALETSQIKAVVAPGRLFSTSREKTSLLHNAAAEFKRVACGGLLVLLARTAGAGRPRPLFLPPGASEWRMGAPG